MEKAGTSGVNSTAILEEEEVAGITYSPQDLPYNAPTKNYCKRGRPPRTMDALTVSISNKINYNTIEFPVACEICSTVYGNGTLLMSHMNTEHSDFVPFECGICSKPFAKINQLQKHMIVHGREKQFDCPICHQKFTRQDCVKVHMRIHDKSQCVHCDVCEKAFLTQAALNIHQRIHRGEKPFKCHLCGKCFTQKNHVIMHIMRHSRVNNSGYQKTKQSRMFQCKSCPRAFIRISDFERHMQWNHGTVEYSSVVHPSVSDAGQQKVNHANIKAFYEKLSSTKTSSHITSSRKTLCTIATQTDNNSEHVIIPSKYQNQGPATPKADEDIYENEMFDEGMDRNYSSDEDEVGKVEPFMGMTNFRTSTSTVDEAFDAVLGKSVGNDTSEEMTNQSHSESLSTKKQEEIKNGKITKEIISKDNSVELEIAKKKISNTAIEIEETKVNKTTIGHKNIKKVNPTIFENNSIEDISAINLGSDVQDKDISLISIYNRNSEDVLSSRNVPKIKTNFDMSNWNSRLHHFRGKPKSALRARSNKLIMGLTGAAHLRLMRKSLMTFITEQGEQGEDENITNEEEMETEAPVGEQLSHVEAKDISGKRQAKAKQHGKDFLCSSKTCEVCQPPTIKPILTPLPKITRKVKKELPIGQYQDKSNKLLQFILSGDATRLQGTDFQLLSEVEDEKRDIMKVDERMERLFEMEGDEAGSNEEQAEVNLDVTEVDFQSVCIPTFSCKLCGREFRFEGKLHRHIELVHQKKVIFSPDVRPGMKKIKMDGSEYFREHLPNKMALVNPEIAALRADWDDDDDEDDSGVEKRPNVVQQTKISKSFNTGRSTEKRFPTYIANRSYQREYSNNFYPQGVKLNLNKVDRLPFSEGKNAKRIKIEHPKPPLPKNVSLETKCSKLLEKLFKMNLLMKCGHNVDHVSTVLGCVLQHYDVKMIEDYGQGQYEVLKYNLWRLIEWKVTMEQMEEFYTQGKSVEEMMDDIMNNRVPITAHTEPADKKLIQVQPALPPINNNTSISASIDSIPINDQLLMTLDGNVTQLVLAQDVSPEMLQGAHIVTIDPATGQVISQVTADQVILAGSVSEEITRHIESIDNHIVVSTNPSCSQSSLITALPPGSIVAEDGTIHISTATIEGELVESDDGKSQNSADNSK